MSRVWKALGALVASGIGILFFAWLGVTDVRVQLATVILVLLTFYADLFGKAGDWLRLGFMVLLVGGAFFVWKFTAPSAKAGKHAFQAWAPAETFDPESNPTPGNPGAAAQRKLIKRLDGTIQDVPLSWKTHPDTGFPIPNPGSPEFAALLRERNERERARKKGEAEESTTSKTVRVSLRPGDKPLSFELSDLIWGSTWDYTWTMPSGKVRVRVYEHGTKLVGQCIVGPGVKEYCDLPYADWPTVSFEALQPAEFAFTVIKTS